MTDARYLHCLSQIKEKACCGIEKIGDKIDIHVKLHEQNIEILQNTAKFDLENYRIKYKLLKI
jgi:hypothetical protein